MVENENKGVSVERKKTTVLPASFRGALDLKLVLADQYMKQIENYFSDSKQAMRFLSGVISAVQRNEKLLGCTPISVVNSFMVMAQLQLMPSDISGEAYVIPYNNSKKIGDKWVKVPEAQFQLGYQGLVTLFYRSGAKEIIAEIVYEKDKFTYKNGVLKHNPDVFAADRGKAKGAYVIVKLGTGGTVTKVMSKAEILDIAEKFSKSFKSDSTPWDPVNDPQLWMWRKTVLKQIAKMVPKNEVIIKAIAEDNKDSIIADRLEAAREESEGLTMGNLLKDNEESKDKTGDDKFDSAKSAEIDAEATRTGK